MSSFKALIVILGISGILFYFARPLLLKFSSDPDFKRRRNIWMGLTAVAFLSPNFWLFVLIAAPLLWWSGKRDGNAVALYLLLLHVIPPDGLQIPPPPGMSELFELDNYRLMAFTILLPAALRLRRELSLARPAAGRPVTVDAALIVFGLINVVLFIPPDLPGHVLLNDSATNVMRRLVLFGLDAWLLYYVISRSSRTVPVITESIAWLCMGCALMAAIATFETLKHWLLYSDLTIRWQSMSGGFYLMRGDSLRASASAGPALVLGVLLAVATGLWVSLMPRFEAVRTRIVVMAVLWAGLLASYSRGPWLGAIAMYVVYIGIGPRALTKMVKGGIVAVLLGTVVLASPLGDRIIKVMPFFGGSVDNYNVIYRQRLAARSWEILSRSPFFGDQHALLQMDDLRQGQGIVDLVNTFTTIALFYGFVGLTVFLAFILGAAYQAFKRARQLDVSDPATAALGYALVGTIVGLMIMLWATSFFIGAEKMFYILAAFAAGYSQLRVDTQAVPQTAATPRSRKAWAPLPPGSMTPHNAGNQP